MYEALHPGYQAGDPETQEDAQRELLADVAELKQLLRGCWSKETSSQPQLWSPECPEIGQCGCTALLVQDLFGGEVELLELVIRHKDPNEVGGSLAQHLRNRIMGLTVDLTVSQYAVTNPDSDVLVFDRVTQRDGFKNIKDWTRSREKPWQQYLMLTRVFARNNPDYLVRIFGKQPAQKSGVAFDTST